MALQDVGLGCDHHEVDARARTIRRNESIPSMIERVGAGDLETWPSTHLQGNHPVPFGERPRHAATRSDRRWDPSVIDANALDRPASRAIAWAISTSSSDDTVGTSVWAVKLHALCTSSYATARCSYARGLRSPAAAAAGASLRSSLDLLLGVSKLLALAGFSARRSRVLKFMVRSSISSCESVGKSSSRCGYQSVSNRAPVLPWYPCASQEWVRIQIAGTCPDDCFIVTAVLLVAAVAPWRSPELDVLPEAARRAWIRPVATAGCFWVAAHCRSSSLLGTSIEGSSVSASPAYCGAGPELDRAQRGLPTSPSCEAVRRISPLSAWRSPYLSLTPVFATLLVAIPLLGELPDLARQGVGIGSGGCAARSGCRHLSRAIRSSTQRRCGRRFRRRSAGSLLDDPDGVFVLVAWRHADRQVGHVRSVGTPTFHACGAEWAAWQRLCGIRDGGSPQAAPRCPRSACRADDLTCLVVRVRWSVCWPRSVWSSN